MNVKVKFNIEIGSVDLGESMMPRFENLKVSVETEMDAEEMKTQGENVVKIIPAIKEVIEQARLGIE